MFGAWQWDETVVPEIEGKTLEEATKLLKDAKLEIDIDEGDASTQYERLRLFRRSRLRAGL